MDKKTSNRLREWVNVKIDNPKNVSFHRDHSYQQWKAWSRYKVHNQKNPNLIPTENGRSRSLWHEALFFQAVWNNDYENAKNELYELTRFACLTQRILLGLPNFDIKEGCVLWRDVFLNYAITVAIDDKENESILGHYLAEGAKWEGHKIALNKGGLDDGAIGRFLVELFAISYELKSDFSFEVDLRPEFRILLENLRSSYWTEVLDCNFDEALSYHASLSIWNDDYDGTCFETNPRYFIAAFELMAFLRYRKRAGLEVPHIEHTLINPLWDAIKESKPDDDEDPVRLGVIERAKKEFPNFK